MEHFRLRHPWYVNRSHLLLHFGDESEEGRGNGTCIRETSTEKNHSKQHPASHLSLNQQNPLALVIGLTLIDGHNEAINKTYNLYSVFVIISFLSIGPDLPPPGLSHF